MLFRSTASPVKRCAITHVAAGPFDAAMRRDMRDAVGYVNV
jgi:hypothetical protein